RSHKKTNRQFLSMKDHQQEKPLKLHPSPPHLSRRSIPIDLFCGGSGLWVSICETGEEVMGVI
ncbi:MAG: hypothetical protein RID25_10400, partial [Cyclobacteriaceae bacterium]